MRSYYTAGRLAKSEQSQLSGSDTGGGGAGAGTPEGPPAHVAVRPAALEISERAVWHHGRRDVLCTSRLTLTEVCSQPVFWQSQSQTRDNPNVHARRNAGASSGVSVRWHAVQTRRRTEGNSNRVGTFMNETSGKESKHNRIHVM